MKLKWLCLHERKKSIDRMMIAERKRAGYEKNSIKSLETRPTKKNEWEK